MKIFVGPSHWPRVLLALLIGISFGTQVTWAQGQKKDHVEFPQDFPLEKAQAHVRLVRGNKLDDLGQDYIHKNVGKILLQAVEKEGRSDEEVGEDDMPLAPPKMPKNINGFMKEYPNLHKIISEDKGLCDDNLTRFINLQAHGTAEDKGGLPNFINIFVEGMIFSRFMGSLSYNILFSGMNYMMAGRYGPFYTILDEEALEKDKTDALARGRVPENFHLVYLIPDDKLIAEKITKALDLAERKFLISGKERAVIDSKIFTYQQFLDLFPDEREAVTTSLLKSKLADRGRK